MVLADYRCSLPDRATIAGAIAGVKSPDSSLGGGLSMTLHLRREIPEDYKLCIVMKRYSHGSNILNTGHTRGLKAWYFRLAIDGFDARYT